MASTAGPIEIQSSEPGWFQAAKRMQRAGIRGGYRVQRIAADRFWAPSRGVGHRLTDRVSVVVPIGSRHYDGQDVVHYEDRMVDYFSDLLNSTNREVTLIDCGADFGLVSAKLVAACPSIGQVIGFEPNPEVFGFLDHNLRSWPVDGAAYPKAVADWVGRGELRRPSFDSSAHAAFLAESADGEVDVVSIDSLGLDVHDVVGLKVDVEGGELPVINGASEMLASATDFAVVFEAHPLQIERVGTDPIEVINALRRIRDCRAVVTERPALKLQTDRPFKSQVSDDQIYNICVTTIG